MTVYRVYIAAMYYDEDPTGTLGTIYEVTTPYAVEPDAVVREIRAAVKQWSKTQEAQDAMEEVDDYFNWGDFSYYLESIKTFLPKWIYNIEPLQWVTKVDHDEILARPITEEQ